MRCKCPCGEAFEPNRSDQEYATPACRTRASRARRAQRAARRYKGVTRPRSKTRYAVVQVRGAVIEILAFDSGWSKQAVRRAFGLGDRQDLEVVPARHLPAVS